MSTAKDMASSSSTLPPEQAARLAEAMRPTTDAVAAFADQLAGVTRDLRLGLVTVPPVPVSVLRLVRRWASMSPRQRRAALVEELRAGITRAGANLRAALDRGLACIADLMRSAPRTLTDADPLDGQPLALVLLDSTRPIHGPPLPA